MVRRLLASLFGKRYAFEMAILIAVLIISVNEYTYRTTKAVLSAGISLTEERISAGRLLQALTDAEAGQRGYLLTQDEIFLAPYKKAMAELPHLRKTVVPYLELGNPVSAIQINEIISSRLSEMATTIQLAQGGSGQLALDIVKAGAGSEWMDKLRRMIDDQLTSGEHRQSAARLSIYDALALNYSAVILLTLCSLFAVYVFIRQIRLQENERAVTEEGLQTAIETRTLELRQLAQHLQTVREAEKDHLARELHDQLGALLTVAKLDLEGLRKQVVNEPHLTARVERVGSRINEVIVLKRRMVEDMRPSALSMLGLRSALMQHCREMGEAMNVPFHVNIDEVSLAPESDLIIYRFVQEALTNIAKYSHAKNVWVDLLKKDNRLDILVRDDGAGFDPDLALAGHHGLTGMRYRIDSLGGTMSLASKPGEGTTIRAIITV